MLIFTLIFSQYAHFWASVRAELNPNVYGARMEAIDEYLVNYSMSSLFNLDLENSLLIENNFSAKYSL